MGAPVEGWEANAIGKKFERWDFRYFIPSRAKEAKGNGRITDDTLMVEALIRSYQRKGGHLDAYDFRDFLLPEIVETIVWLPERQRNMPIFDRLNAVEKYAWYRLSVFGAEPRVAGIGNAINCAVAMFIWPVGAINATDCESAYNEAAAFAAAESSSYAVEAAAVLAAAFAAAFSIDASVDSVLNSATRLARDGTASAINAVLQATDPQDDRDTFIAQTRVAFIPFDHKQSHVPLESGGRMPDNNQPSSRLSLEEVPIALAALKWGNGDFLRTLSAAVSYGRDCDSIAAMACGLLGAITGEQAIPSPLRVASDKANRRDWRAIAARFTQTIKVVSRADKFKLNRRLLATVGKSL